MRISAVHFRSEACSAWLMRRMIYIAVVWMVLMPSVVFSQSTQPASVYDHQPLKRTRADSQTTPSAGSTFDWSRLVLAMGVVFGLIFVLRILIGKMYPGTRATKGAKVVRVLTRSPIAPKQQVMLLQIGRRVIVVSDSAGHLSTLSEISDPDEVASLVGQIETEEVSAPVSRFASFFTKAQTDYESETTGGDDAIPETTVSGEDRDIQQAQTEISGLIERMKTLARTVKRD